MNRAAERTALRVSLITALAGAATGWAALSPPPMPTQPDLYKQPTLYVVGYAHLDTQWRWTYVDTITQFIPNTLNHNFALFDKYPEYVFNFSGSRRYRMMEEYYPKDFEKLKGYVASGKWFPCGSSVDENDANVPSGESLIRQVLYGNKYFRAQFGVASDEFMLPDCFGFPAALPTILAHCGIKGFSTQKLTWGGVVPIPFKIGMWEGPDGSTVAAALDPGAYVGEVKENLANSESWKARIDATAAKSGVHADYHYFGTGDQGGAPKEPSVKMVQESVNTAGPIKVMSSQADWLFKTLTPDMRSRLPVYKGELELTEHSAGSISSQAYMKRWNRKNELLADSAERASVGAWILGGRAYPSQKIEDAWYLVLGSQMHDILPGTSVPRAYDFSWNDEVLAGNQFAQVLSDGAGVVISQMDTRVDAGQAIVVFNPLSIDREDIVEADLALTGPAPKAIKVTGPDGKSVPAQILKADQSTLRIAFLAKAPSVGFATYAVDTSAAAPDSSSTLRVSERQLENEAYTVKLDDNGDVASIFDKRAKREVLSAPARIGLHYENPRQWPAWNQDWADRQKPAMSFAGGPVTFKVVESGPARVAVEVTRQAEGSTFTQRIRLSSGGAAARVEFDTDIDWRTRERSVRAAFPLACANPLATYDIQAGAIQRGNGHEKQFEYPFHQWLDLTATQGDYGVSLMSDSKYATDKPDDKTVRLTLLHTPGTRGGYPDQATQDLGRHHVLYALSAHAGDWRTGSTPAQASRLNQPLAAFLATAHQGALGKSFSLAKVSDPSVAITALKKAEAGDQVIVRLRELSGSTVKGVRVTLPSAITAAHEVDGQERQLAAANTTGNDLITDMKGFSLRTFALTLAPTSTKTAAVTSTPVTLAFDTDAVSTNANPADGSFDGSGAIPAEQFPANLSAEGMTFAFGPTADGQKNALTCDGQEIALPKGNFDTLCLIAAAEKDTAATITIDGASQPWNVQAWNGMIGQWDRRVWASEISDDRPPSSTDFAGLEPGFIKRDPVAWYCSHHHTPKGDAVYMYSYLFKYTIDLKPGAKTVKLPTDRKIKLFAASVALRGPDRSAPVSELFDTLSAHQADAPRVLAPSKPSADAIQVTIEPGMYWRAGRMHYTLDGSKPTAQSPVYTGPITLASTSTVSAAVLGADGVSGPVASTKVEVSDHTAPSVRAVAAVFQSRTMWVDFSEPVKSADAASFHIEPAIAVSGAAVSDDGRRVALTLASPPESGKQYTLHVSGVKDVSPAGNTAANISTPFTVAQPVYTLNSVKPDQRDTVVKDVKGLPVKASDPWTINVFVKTDKPVQNRTVIAGFGRCDGKAEGTSRYFCKFASGVQFWSHNRDVESHTPLEQGKWQMLTATFDGKLVRIYKDAKLVAQGASQLADDFNEIHILPKDPWENRRQFEGDVKDLTIWNAPLGEDSLLALRSAASLP